MKEDLNDLIFKRATPKIILACRDKLAQKNQMKISKKAGCTYSYTVLVLAKLRDNNIIKVTRSGRTCATELTEKGNKIASLIEELNELLRASE